MFIGLLCVRHCAGVQGTMVNKADVVSALLETALGMAVGGLSGIHKFPEIEDEITCVCAVFFPPWGMCLYL